ncbi:MAG: carboxypeptidase-like regulatory domain-containing protein [Candidatus Solibacter sp.]
MFTGTVLAVTDPVWPRPIAIPGPVQSARRSLGDPPETLARPLRTVRMQVREVLSGIGPGQKEIEVGTGMGGGDCGFGFQVGTDYVVYAYKNAEGRLETGICSRTRLLSQAAEDVEYIRAKANGPSTGEIRVRTGIGNISGKPGLTIAAQGSGSRYTAFTNAAGEALFPSLQPGAYTIHAEQDGDLPDDPKLQLNAKGCLDVTLFRALRIDGRVTTRSGEPAARIEVQTRTVDGSPGDSATTDPDGRYQLRIVKPGQYYLGINLNHTPTQYTPYPRWFYPGTDNQASAISIAFSGRPETRTYDLALPDRQPERSIEGIVSRTDGQPKPRVLVTIRDASRTVVAQAFADQSGRFSAHVFAGTAYRLHAVWPGNAADAAASAVPVEIEPGTSALTLRLTLTQPGNSWLDEQQQRR